MSLLSRLFARTDPRETARPLHNAVVALGREPVWYAKGGVPDTVDGRFEAIAMALCLVLIRMEAEGDNADIRQQSVFLAELFVEDMDGQLRQFGIGDLIVGKHIGKMMSALGGRLGAYRTALAEQDAAALEEALSRNLYREEPVGAAELACTRQHVFAAHAALAALPFAQVLAGQLDPVLAVLRTEAS